MAETRTIKGEVESWSSKINEFGRNNKGSRGVKIEGNWHNQVGTITELEALHNLFPRGCFVEFQEKKNLKNFWDIDGDIKKITKEVCYPVEAHRGIPESAKTFNEPKKNVDKDILFAVAFKGAIELIANQTVAKNENDAASATISLTEKLYLGLKEKKLQLQEKGEW